MFERVGLPGGATPGATATDATISRSIPDPRPLSGLRSRAQRDLAPPPIRYLLTTYESLVGFIDTRASPSASLWRSMRFGGWDNRSRQTKPDAR